MKKGCAKTVLGLFCLKIIVDFLEQLNSLWNGLKKSLFDRNPIYLLCLFTMEQVEQVIYIKIQIGNKYEEYRVNKNINIFTPFLPVPPVLMEDL